MASEAAGPGLMERLEAGAVLCAQGYVFELERRGYLQAGPFVPEAVLDHPEVVRRLHRDCVHAGSDVVVALTYYAHRAELRLIGKEDLVEPLNREALAIAREVAAESGALLAGDVCDTNIFEADDPASAGEARAMFEEQVAWAVDAGVDYVIGETFDWLGEALIALDVIRAAGKPAVITLSVPRTGLSWEGVAPEECCRRLEDAGADVVGLNCARGPATMLPVLTRVRRAVACHVAALPVPYRTSEAEPTFQSLTDPGGGAPPEGRPFPTALDPFTCTRYEMAAFAEAASGMGVRYLGACCGAGPHHIRAMAEALGRRPPASRYAPAMARHPFFGTDAAVKESYRRRAGEL